MNGDGAAGVPVPIHPATAAAPAGRRATRALPARRRAGAPPASYPPFRFPPRPEGFPPGYGAPPPATPDSPTDPGFSVPPVVHQWPEALYATGPHQPTYPPSAAPPQAEQRTDGASLLDLHPGPDNDRPAADGDDRRDGRPRALVALAGLGALVVLAAATVGVVSLRHHGSHPAAGPTTNAPAATSTTAPRTGSSATRRTTTAPAPTTAPAGQEAARIIDRAITRSVAARKLIGPANKHIRACTARPGDIAALRRAGKARTDLVTALAGIDVASLPGGARVVADLRTAWTYSARADQAYAAWGRAHRNCTGQAPTTGDPNFDRAHRNDLRSTAAKGRAVKDWNPLAARYHLTARTAATI